MNNRQSKIKVVKRYGYVMVNNPHIQSSAALTQLIQKLAKQDHTFYSPKKWLRFRKHFLKDILAKMGTIICFYCGIKDLIIETKNKNKIATLDHYYPVSRGGGLYDLDNIVPACYTCNRRKGDTIIKGRK